MTTNTIGWASFFNEASSRFSKSFQTEMAQQLMQQFNTLTGIENFASNKNFMLFVGLTDLETMYKDGYAFSLVEIICPSSLSETITIYWNAEDNEQITQQDSIKPGQVKIGWCSDFNKELFLSFSKEKVITVLKSIKLHFKYICNLQLFPDLNIQYKFKTALSETELNDLKNLLRSTYENAYVSEIENSEGKYYSIIDFQEVSLRKGKKQIETFILALNNSDFANKIDSITIE